MFCQTYYGGPYYTSKSLRELGFTAHNGTNAGISGQPKGATPGQLTGNPGAWQGICSKGMPHTRGIRALLRFWQNTPGPYPRDLHVICCLNVQRFSPQDKQARSIDILRPLCPRGKSYHYHSN